MDLATIIIAVVSIVICSLPFVMVKINKGKREGELLSEIKKNSKNESIHLSKYELLSNFIIGIDETSNHFYFLRKKEDSNHFLEIDLNKYAKCEMQQSNHTEGENNSVQSVIDQLALKFHPANASEKMILLELYNRSDNQNLSGEFQLAQEWTLFLNKRNSEFNQQHNTNNHKTSK